MTHEHLVSFLLHAYCVVEHADNYSVTHPNIIKHSTKKRFNDFLEDFNKHHGKQVEALFAVEDDEEGNRFVNTQVDVDEAIRRIAKALCKLPKATLPSLAEQIELVTIQ